MRIFYSNVDGNLTGLDADGAIRWSIWLNLPVFASPLVAPDGIVYVVNGGGMLNAVGNNSPLLTGPWPMFRANPRHTGVVNSPPH